MKRQKAVMFWTVIFLIVIAGLCVYFFCKASESAIYYKNNIEIFRCLPEEITEYTVSDKKGEYTLKKQNDEWIIKGKDISKPDVDAINRLLYSASDIKAVGTITKRGFSEFSTTDARKLKIVLTKPDGIEKIVEIRFLGTLNGLTAFMIDNNSKIFVMNQSVFEILTPKLNNLRSLYVFEGLAETESLPGYLRYVDYDGGEFAVRKKTAAELAKNKSNQFIMESPYKKDVDDEKFEQQIVVKVSAIQANEFIREPENLDGMGLDENSRAELTFVWNDEPQTLYLGKNNGGYVYAKRKNIDGIFRISSSFLEFLQIDPFYILDNKVLTARPENIQSITIKVNDETFSLTSVNKGSDTAEYHFNEKLASEDVFESIVEQLEKIEIVGEATASSPKTDKIVITVNCKNASENQTISLSLMNNKNYAVFMGDKSEFAADGKAIEELLVKLKNANNNPMKINKRG